MQPSPHSECLAAAHAAITAAFQVIERIHCAMSAHDPQSDLGRLARAALGEVVNVDPDTVIVLRAAARHHRMSAGRFDPVRAAGVLARQGRRPAFAGVFATAPGHLLDLELVDRSHIRVVAPVCVDLGGIAKGYAVDRAIDSLRAAGVVAALVNAGGDLRAFGPLAWPIQVRDPRAPTRVRSLPNLASIRASALATSVATPKHADDFVPSSTAPTSMLRSCTVAAPDCMTADALTKWALQSSPRDEGLARAPASLGATLWFR